MTHAIAGFPEARTRLAELVRVMKIDTEALRRPLRRCDLAVCRGTCCHDGAYLTSEEARVVRELSAGASAEWEEIGLSLPDTPVVYGKWRDVASGPKTATRPARDGALAEDFPKHFAKTRCVFLLRDARCGLQVLAAKRGWHPWSLKPLTCWLHPLSILSPETEAPILTLHDEDSDPQRFEDYDGFVCRTHCGRTAAGGRPAWEVLGEELRVLGEVGERDLVGEIRARLEPPGSG